MKKLVKKAAALIAVAAMAVTSLVGCGSTSVDNSKVVATVGDSEITLGMANFYLRYQQSYMDTVYESYFGSDIWKVKMEDGSTYEENFKKTAIETLQNLYLITSHADEYNITLTEEELAAIEETAEAFDKDNSSSAKQKVSGDKKIIIEYLKLATINDKMADAMVADVDTEVSDDEAAQKKMRFVMFEFKAKMQDGTELIMTEEQIAEVKAKAEDFYNTMLKEKPADMSLKDYADSLDITSYPITFDSESTVVSKDLIKAADVLEENEFSGLVEADDGFYVVQLESLFDKDATEEKKAEIVTERKDAKYNELCESWKKDVKITVNEDVWKKIRVLKLKVLAQ